MLPDLIACDSSSIMDEEETGTVVAQDLKHIQLGPDSDIQHEHRVLFNAQRRSDIAKGQTRKETITFCIDFVRQTYPGWQPNVDRDYFDLG